MTGARPPRPAVSLLSLAALLPALALVGAPAASAQRAGREFRPAASLTPDPRLDELMQRFERAQEETKTMTATFEQVKEDELFAEATVLTGRFAFQGPDLFRWDYQAPEPVTVIATPDLVKQYIPSQKLLRQTDISKKRRRAMNYLGIGSDVQNLRRHFDIDFVEGDAEHAGTDKIELRAKNRRIQKRLALMEMWIDRTSSLPIAVRTTMADGSRTGWSFKDMAVNVPLADGTFDLQPPPGTRVEVGGKKKASVVDDLVEDDDQDDAGTAPAGG